MLSHHAKLRGLSVGTREWFEAQKALIYSKPLLKQCYDDWYRRLLEDEGSVPASKRGALLEIGSGGSYLKDLRPDVVTSDVISGVADQVVDARNLPFDNESVRALFLTHALHHIPDVELFFAEAERVLVDGGVISMIEVARTPLARPIFSRFHPEPFDDRAVNWTFSQSDAMNDSNQALSWIVFVRDRDTFARRFPNLRLEALGYLPWFGYLVSGGVTREKVWPSALDPLAHLVDWLTKPLAGVFSLHWHLRVRKVTGPGGAGHV